MFCIRSYVSMEEHLESCENLLQEMISAVEMLKKQVCITSDCQYKPVCMYVRTYVHVCMLITHLVNSMGRCMLKLTCIQSMWQTTFYCRPHVYPERRVYVYSTIHTCYTCRASMTVSYYVYTAVHAACMTVM